MQTRLLIINCPSSYFIHVPMGTFGLCDYLGRRNISSKILNLALYDNNAIVRNLDSQLVQFRPSHIALIFH